MTLFRFTPPQPMGRGDQRDLISLTVAIGEAELRRDTWAAERLREARSQLLFAVEFAAHERTPVR